MKCLVTGCAGFIGSHLCEELIKLGYDVIGIDDLSAGKTSNIRKGVTFYRVDITDVAALESLFIKYKIDIVFNQMASKKTVCLRDPKRDLDVNGKGTLGLLQLSEKYGVKKFIHASTGSVYGECGETITENSPINPCSYYGVSKLAGDNYVRIFSERMNCTILRYFHVYGERQDDSDLGGVIAIFAKKILNDKELTIFGTGDQQRLFTYVKDVVKANIAAIDYNGGIFNCASNEAFTLHDLIREIELISGKKASIGYGEWTIGDTRNFSIDNSLVKDELGIEFTKFKDGLKYING